MGEDEPHHLGSCGRRGNPRLRLRLPALLITLHGQGPAVLENVSRSGARISSRFVLQAGESCILRLPGIELFADVAWCAHWRCGLNFERPLAQAQLLALRELDGVSRPSERDANKDWARAFVNGAAEHRR
ncbi:MAG: hypothetical protein EBR34_12925 [Sphingomonadaceae bacterium]|nr:hypothetical protein [Sphingomonadaceae bacterium]